MFQGKAALEHETNSRCIKVGVKEEEKRNRGEIKKVQEKEKEGKTEA